MPTGSHTASKTRRPGGAPRAGERLNAGLKNVDLLKIYRYMLTTRAFEDAVLRLYQQGKIVGGAYSGNGNEATSVGSAYALSKQDYLFPLHRDLGAHLVKGQSLLNLMLQHLGRDTGMTRGRDGTGHYSDPSLRIYGNISHLGAMLPVACGVALAVKMRKEQSVVMTYIGDGGASIGEVHEALCMASAMRLPLVLMIENNQYAYSTPSSKQFIVDRLSKRAVGYGIPGVTIDGTDVTEVYQASREAVGRARGGQGPTLIESVTMRMHGHAAHDNAWYVPKKLIAEWKKKDPVERLETLLAEKGILSPQQRAALVKEIEQELDAAVNQALQRPYPNPEEAGEGVFA